MDYDYPGNVRELINILERSALLGERDFVKLMKEHRELNAGLSSTHPSSPPKLPMATDEANCVVTLEEAMRWHVRFVYEHCGGNLAEASRKLDVSRNTVRKYL
jgi:DNA-binding NtrC family response regulator